MKPKVAIIMGSDSDLLVMNEAVKILQKFNVDCETKILSAHRTPNEMSHFAKSAKENGFQVIIAGAGGAAHLPGMTAAYTTLPVIGVPIKTKSLEGLDSLASIMQMPPGVPVATVAINGAQNAGLLAVEILGVSNPDIASKLEDYKKNMEQSTKEKNLNLEKLGPTEYMNANPRTSVMNRRKSLKT